MYLHAECGKSKICVPLLHSVQYGKPSLVCDFMEIYRYLMDDFLIEYCRNLHAKDFIVKSEVLSRKRQGKRQYLNSVQTRDLMKRLHKYFECVVDVPRVRIGNRQTIETLISEEALLFAKFLRDERKTWIPRIPILRACDLVNGRLELKVVPYV